MVGSGEETLDDDELTAEIDEDEDDDEIPVGRIKAQRQGKTFKTIPLATDSSNETSKIVSLSLLEEKERGEDEARALRTYTRLNRTRLTLSTRLQEKTQSEPLDTTTRRSYSVPQRFRIRSTTPIPSKIENSEEDDEETKDNEGPSPSTTTVTPPSIKLPTRRLFTPRRPVNAVEDSDSSDIRKYFHLSETKLVMQIQVICQIAFDCISFSWQYEC